MPRTSKRRRWAAIRRAIAKQPRRLRVNKLGCVLVNGDARILLKSLPAESIDCIVTSPPYGSLKNYGAKKQLGYGQHVNNQYLPDLEGVLAELFRVARQGATLWLVLDSIRANGEALMLPWEIARRAQLHGWKLHDIIVWDKGRSLPWSHKGQFRGVCEFVVLLSKGPLQTYDLNAVRDFDDLSGYWVKYPERFNPQGKAPSDLWHFPIPVQGSWSKGPIRHFCPFPLALVSRILTISTKEGHVVLDPFAGTGSVIATAAALGRHGCGIEVNQTFVKSFDSNGFDSFFREIKLVQTGSNGHRMLSRSIRRLRLLKYPKSLFVEIARDDRLGRDALKYIAAFVIRKVDLRRSLKREINKQFGTAVIEVLISNAKHIARVQRVVAECIKIPPLSKFGLKIDVRVVSPNRWMKARYTNSLERGSWFLYLNGRFHEFHYKVRRAALRSQLLKENPKNKRKYPVIAAPLEVKMDSFK